MKTTLIVLALLLTQTAFSKEMWFRVTEAHYSVEPLELLSVHEVTLEDDKGNEYTLDDKVMVEKILAKQLGKEKLEYGYEFSSIEDDLANISIKLKLNNNRELSSKDKGLLEEYENIKIKNAQITSVQINKDKRHEKKHLPLADTLDSINKLLK